MKQNPLYAYKLDKHIERYRLRKLGEISEIKIFTKQLNTLCDLTDFYLQYSFEENPALKRIDVELSLLYKAQIPKYITRVEATKIKKQKSETKRRLNSFLVL